MGSAYEDIIKTAVPIAESAKQLARHLGEHSQYYKLGKDLGHNFRPWEAVKGAQRIRNVTPALGALTVGLMALDTWRSERAEKQRNAIRHDAASTARQDVQRLVDAYLLGTDEQRGLGEKLQEGLDAVSTELERLDADITQNAARMAEVTSRLGTLRDAVDRNRWLLDPQEETTGEG